MAKEFKKINTLFGIGGVLTFKNSNTLKEVVNNLDLSSFVLETDSPYLSPEPFRGQENEPYNVNIVAKKISELKDIPLEKVTEITTNNAIKLFDLNFKL
jgi:TatD DNase family protein